MVISKDFSIVKHDQLNQDPPGSKCSKQHLNYIHGYKRESIYIYVNEILSLDLHLGYFFFQTKEINPPNVDLRSFCRTDRSNSPLWMVFLVGILVGSSLLIPLLPLMLQGFHVILRWLKRSNYNMHDGHAKCVIEVGSLGRNSVRKNGTVWRCYPRWKTHRVEDGRAYAWNIDVCRTNQTKFSHMYL